MTTLEAVNRILEAIGEPSVSALDTGGTSEAAEAETHLNRASDTVQRKGWACNTDIEVELTVPDTVLTVTGLTGTFTYGETVTQSVTGATGTFAYTESGVVYLRAVSGTFTGANTITGGSSGATATVTGYSTQTSGKIPVSSGWLTVDPSDVEWLKFATRGSFLYDTDDQTTTFDSEVDADIISDLPFTDLPNYLAEYVVALARTTFERFKKRGAVDDDILAQELAHARADAMQRDVAQRGMNVLATDDAEAMRGGRTLGSLIIPPYQYP